MQRKYFGTDGIRGEAGKYPMDAETALKVGMSAGLQFMRGDHRHRVVIGKDTRLSGYMIESALTAGFVAVGMDVVLVGPIPTPGIAMLTRSLRADLGVMISASHNPFKDNGIKLFGPDGYKLSDEIELKIEARMDKDISANLAPSKNLGRAKRLDDAAGRYIEFVKSSFPKKLNLSGLRIVLDCAHGAAYNLGPTILWELGAEVIPINKSPTGFNINENCGSTYPEIVAAETVRRQADIGLALDGDADRLVVCDEEGNLIDGDQLMALIATDWQEKGRLKKNGVVTTQMSNLGLEIYLKSKNLELKRTNIGDRYVVEEMRRGSYNIGGEQSGHIILSDYSTTGDGLIAALQVLAVLKEKEKKASTLLKVFEAYPQVLLSVKMKSVNGHNDVLQDNAVKKAIADSEKQLGPKGRIFVRKSGTESVIRVMAEGDNEHLIKQLAENIAGEIERVGG